MKILSKITFVLIVSFLMSCESKKEKATTPQVHITSKENKADKIIDLAIKAHGGNQYENHLYYFEFRDREYSFINHEASYKYTVKSNNGENEINDTLNNGIFIRNINKIPVKLSEKESLKYSSSLNSVIYFALLPYKLNDDAVNKDYKGIVEIKGKQYHAIQVTFNQDGGGEDHDDIFNFWINTKNNRIDYLAYKYHVDEGGIRFRKAFNIRNVNDVLFQDYINYKADFNLNLDDLPTLFNQDKLVEVSRIELENIKKHD